uniref:Uncharacterized protein n=1 Tax=Arundo donax TaxID=35708 RepID=A0A0A9ABC6_ARUDO
MVYVLHQMYVLCNQFTVHVILEYKSSIRQARERMKNRRKKKFAN